MRSGSACAGATSAGGESAAVIECHLHLEFWGWVGFDLVEGIDQTGELGSERVGQMAELRRGRAADGTGVALNCCYQPRLRFCWAQVSGFSEQREHPRAVVFRVSKQSSQE